MDSAGNPDEVTASVPLWRNIPTLIAGLLNLPDDEQRFILPAIRGARNIMRREKVDVIYSTAPSFSTHLAALHLRRSEPVRWVAEFRDPWTDTARVANQHRLVGALHQWLERACLKAADDVVMVTHSAGERVAARLPTASRHKVHVAYNGIPRLQEPTPNESAGSRMLIVYAGSFYSERDPRPFLEALAAMCRGRQLGAADIRVEFVGMCREYGRQSVERMVEERGLADLVHFQDWLAHAEVRDLLCRADLLFLIARAQPLQVPNKLFDYLSMRRPILAEVDDLGETARILRQLSGHYVVAGADVAALRKALEAAYDQRSCLVTPDADEQLLSRLSTECQIEALLRSLRL